MIRQLSEKQFRSTFGAKMIDVTESAEAVVDIWPYIRLLNKDGIIAKKVVDSELVEHVYRADTLFFEHVLLLGLKSNEYVVIIINLTGKSIEGHYLLNLNLEYGLT